LYFQHYQIFFDFFPPLKAFTLPAALPLLAALTPSGVEVKIEDENISPIDFDEKVDLVGITGMTSLAHRMYQIADEYQKRGVTVVLGGIHTSMMSTEALDHADAIIIGEAEELWPQLINDYKQNKLKKVYECEHFPDLSKSPIPRWDLLDIKSYIEIPIQTTRGCPFSCDFCTIHAMTGKQFRHKSIANIIKEINFLTELTGKKTITFVDDNMIGNKKFARDLFHALIPLNIKWAGQVSINFADDDHLMKLAHKSGMWQAIIGFESVSQKSLDMINKGKINKSYDYMEKIRRIQENGISILGAMIVGLDGDDVNTFEKTYDFLEKAKIPFTIISILTPLPGTKLYTDLDAQERIIDKNWSHHLPHKACIKPALMSTDTLQEGFYRLVKKLYCFNNTLSRLREQWRRNIFKNVVPFPLTKKIEIAIKLFNTFQEEKLLIYLPITLYYLFLKDVQISSILMALHLHQATNQFPTLKLQFENKIG